MNRQTISSAYELKEALEKDQSFITLNKCEEEMSNDEEVMALCYKKDLLNDEYNDMVRLFPLDSEEVKKAQKRFYEAKKAFESHPKVRDYLKAYSEVRELLDEVNKILFDDLNKNLCPTK